MNRFDSFSCGVFVGIALAAIVLGEPYWWFGFLCAAYVAFGAPRPQGTINV